MSGVREIPLTQGKVALVDEEDYESIAQYNWYASYHYKTWYARRDKKINGKRKRLYLHRVILENAASVDHVNGDGLDCRRSNLRSCSQSENNVNTRFRSNKSGYRGVKKVKLCRNRWAAEIGNGPGKFLGHFGTAEEAAKAYDAAAREKYGEFARVNFPGHQLSDIISYQRLLVNDPPVPFVKVGSRSRRPRHRYYREEHEKWLYARVIIDSESGCWLWTKSRQQKGYGSIGRIIDGQPVYLAHRASWMIFNGDPGSLFVCHKCDVPLCCNPEHLFLGTAADNTLDMVKKRRNSRILTEEQVPAIFKDTRVQRVIAEEYGVVSSTIGLIKTGKNWKHITGAINASG